MYIDICILHIHIQTHMHIRVLGAQHAHGAHHLDGKARSEVQDDSVRA